MQAPSVGPEDIDFASIQHSPEFIELRGRLRRFVFPMTGLFLAWYLIYVLLSSYAPEFMGRPVIGTITMGLVFGVAQLVTTITITSIYRGYAKRRVDPQVRLVRQRAGIDRR
ncbi:MAG: DUF485 domain-containing protein [Kutzneria sp.]|nr:DUF485 domain-containing protein [Kutzneria sp.]